MESKGISSVLGKKKYIVPFKACFTGVQWLMDVHVSHVYIDVFKFIGTQWKMFFWLNILKNCLKLFHFLKLFFLKRNMHIHF